MSFSERFARKYGGGIRETYTYFGEWVIQRVDVSKVHQNRAAVFYDIDVYDTYGRTWKVSRRYTDFSESKKWIKMYDKKNCMPKVPFPRKDHDSTWFRYVPVGPEEVERIRAELNVWLNVMVDFCTNSPEPVKVRIQSEINYLLRTGENLRVLTQPQAQIIMQPPPFAQHQAPVYYQQPAPGTAMYPPPPPGAMYHSAPPQYEAAPPPQYEAAPPQYHAEFNNGHPSPQGVYPPIAQTAPIEPLHVQYGAPVVAHAVVSAPGTERNGATSQH